MYKSEEFTDIDRKYFRVLSVGCYNIILQSKTTRHIWCIHQKELTYGKSCSIEIYHKHKKDQPFHVQKRYHPTNLVQAQILIKDHDMWFMGKQAAL